jgi:hypothetical protein
MRLKGILLATLFVAALTVACGSMGFSPMFDMSKWTTDTYPAFEHGSLTDVKSPAFTSTSFGGTDLQKISYKPVFDMSPGAFSFDTYPAFANAGSQGTGVIFGTMMGSMSHMF